MSVNDEHNVIRMSNGQYRCDNCCEIGEGLWAVSHQFPPRGEWSDNYRGDGSGTFRTESEVTRTIRTSTSFQEGHPPSISFVIGTKRLTFTLNNDGLIDVGYDPEDFTAGALRVVEEVKRLLSER